MNINHYDLEGYIKYIMCREWSRGNRFHIQPSDEDFKKAYLDVIKIINRDKVNFI
jgi:hypothetical protein